MKQIKKLIVATLLFFAMQAAFATTSMIQSKDVIIGGAGTWKLKKKLVPLYFRFSGDNTLTVHLNNTADTIYVYCYAKTPTRNNRVAPGSSLTCFRDSDDTIMVDIETEDFKNGSTGTYEFSQR